MTLEVAEIDRVIIAVIKETREGEITELVM